MAVIHERDLERGRESFNRWRTLAETDEKASTSLGRSTLAMAVRYSLHLLETKAPGGAVEIRVAPWGAVKILDGPRSDPHNLTPPDVVELDPTTWLRLASGMTSWDEERRRGTISSVGERDDLSALLPLV
ncbi:sterol carrier family protein [uncultured Bifidobacterium sp.]|uniref:sterol carrier family protein n=1 Tax=uncultured Bifidobacterium sp. TaxID=165187 RepID=UPI002602F694|nr:sterol carrier family protein [uncultured Bifidobacterium sp.]